MGESGRKIRRLGERESSLKAGVREAIIILGNESQRNLPVIRFNEAVLTKFTIMDGKKSVEIREKANSTWSLSLNP